MKRVIVGFLVISFSLLIKSCDTTDPPDNKSLNLKLEDVSCTEAWITLTTTNLRLPAAITLKQTNPTGDTKSQILNLNTQDSILFVDSLLPNKSYTFIASHSGLSGISSNELSVTTMDTTTHNFTFETFTFGDFGNSVLFDVSIVGSEIWAVGEINIADTSINGYSTYNLMHWDGASWNLQQIMFYTICGQESRTPYPARAIFNFSENEFWVAMDGDQIAKIENEVQTETICLPWSFSVHKIWGRINNDFFVVGSEGNIAHYQNATWSRIESETDVDLKDIWGTSDGNDIWTCGWSNQNGRAAILRIEENAIESIWDSQTNTALSIYTGTLLNSLWTSGSGEFVLVGGQIFRHSLIDKRIVRREWVPTLNGWKVLDLGNFAYRIRGSNKNNIIVAGDAAMIWHYNGNSWYKFEEIYHTYDRIYGLAVQENIIVAVGKRYGTGLGDALLIIGRR